VSARESKHPASSKGKSRRFPRAPSGKTGVKVTDGIREVLNYKLMLLMREPEVPDDVFLSTGESRDFFIGVIAEAATATLERAEELAETTAFVRQKEARPLSKKVKRAGAPTSSSKPRRTQALLTFRGCARSSEHSTLGRSIWTTGSGATRCNEFRVIDDDVAEEEQARQRALWWLHGRRYIKTDAGRMGVYDAVLYYFSRTGAGNSLHTNSYNNGRLVIKVHLSQLAFVLTKVSPRATSAPLFASHKLLLVHSTRHGYAVRDCNALQVFATDCSRIHALRDKLTPRTLLSRVALRDASVTTPGDSPQIRNNLWLQAYTKAVISAMYSGVTPSHRAVWCEELAWLHAEANKEQCIWVRMFKTDEDNENCATVNDPESPSRPAPKANDGRQLTKSGSGASKGTLMQALALMLDELIEEEDEVDNDDVRSEPRPSRNVRNRCLVGPLKSGVAPCHAHVGDSKDSKGCMGSNTAESAGCEWEGGAETKNFPSTQHRPPASIGCRGTKECNDLASGRFSTSGAKVLPVHRARPRHWRKCRRESCGRPDRFSEVRRGEFTGAQQCLSA